MLASGTRLNFGRSSVRIEPINVTVAALIVFGLFLSAYALVSRRARAASILAAGLLSAFTGLAIGVQTHGWVTSLDTSIATWFSLHRSPGLDTAALVIAVASGPAAIAVAGLVLGALLSWRAKSLVPGAIVIGTVGAGALVAKTVIKAVVATAPIPAELQWLTIWKTPAHNLLTKPGRWEHTLLPAQQHSFPSGHVTGTAALLGVIALCIGTGRSRIVRSWLAGLVLAGVLVVAGSRLYLSVHWLTDVLGGILLAGVFVALAAWALVLLSPASPDSRRALTSPADALSRCDISATPEAQVLPAVSDERLPATVLVEPNPSGHRFQTVAHLAVAAERTSKVVLLSSRGATVDPSFQEYLGYLNLDVEEVFDTVQPTARQLAHSIARACQRHGADRVVLLDSDQALKRWWYVVPLEFRMRRRPRIVFLLTRYPAKLRIRDKNGWLKRITMTLLALMAQATGSLHRISCFAGRDDFSKGWVVKRARDPEICTAHSRDRAAARAALDLPGERRLVGIFGGISERKFPYLIWDALQAHQIRADLILGGKLSPGVREWVATRPSSSYGRVVARDRFLSNVELDQMVAAADVVALAMTNNGPSGIMGKALAAGVPVVTAGSEVRAREVRATGGGEIADLTADSLGAAVTRLLARAAEPPRRNTVPPATGEDFAQTVLGRCG